MANEKNIDLTGLGVFKDELDKKYQLKESGKGLSTNDYSDEEKQKVSTINNKADKSEMSVIPGTGNDSDKTTITLKSGTSITVLTQHQNISSDLATKANVSDVYNKGEVNGLIANVIDSAPETLNTLKKISDKLSDNDTIVNTLTNTVASKANASDVYTKTETYTKTEVNGLVDTPHQEYVTVDAFANLPATGSKDTIYRVSNYNGSTSQVDASVYSEYAWDGSQYIFLCVKSQIGEVFDISVYNNNAKYADLAAALGTNGANIPQSLQKGGMSVKFVQSSDNKYVQYRLTASGWSTDIHDWTSEDPYFIDKIMQEVNEAIDENTPIEIHGDVNNAADEEDLTSVNIEGTDVLKFKDKAYNPLTYSGMGRKILRKNIVDGINTLTQNMMQATNTIYVIQYDFDLNGESVTIPENCVLEFDGGSLSNGTLTGQNTVIDAELVDIFKTDLTLSGTWNVPESYPEWFGAKGDGETDDTMALQKVLDSAKFRSPGVNITNIILQRGKTYCITNTLDVYPFTCIGGALTTKFDNFPIIKDIGSSDIDILRLCRFVTIPSRINIHNLYISGNNNGIVLGNDVGNFNQCAFKDLFFSDNIKRGISFVGTNDSGDMVNSFFENIFSTKNIEIPIYINTPRHAYGITFKNIQAAHNKVGGIYLRANAGITTPIVFDGCVFDHIGENYDLETYAENGCFGIYLNYQCGLVEIKDCYFEINGPLKKNDEPVQTAYGYTEKKTPTGYTYIINPDFSKTADIVFHGGRSTWVSRLDVHDTHFTALYQALSLVGAGNLHFYDNELIIPNVTALGIDQDQDFPIQNSIVKLKADTLFGENADNMCVDIDHRMVYTERNIITHYIYEAIGYDNTFNPLRLIAKVNIPIFNRVFEYNYLGSRQYYGEPATIYVGASSIGLIRTGTPMSPLESIKNAFMKIKDANIKKANVILLEDSALPSDNNSEENVENRTFPSGCDIKITSFNKKKLSLSSFLVLKGSNVEINNIILEQVLQTSGLRISDCNLVVRGTEMIKGPSNTVFGIITNTGGYSVISINKGCSITTTETTPGYFVKKTTDSIRCKVYVDGGVSNPSDIPYETDN